MSGCQWIICGKIWRRWTARVYFKARRLAQRTFSSLHHSLLSNISDTMTSNPSPNNRVTESNYECILQGTHMSRGLVYSTDFISTIKERQNQHKEQERQRRKRLHAAIADLQRRLPSDESSYWKCSLSVKPPQTGCKAATVEAATTYIAHLEEQLELLKRSS